MVQMRRESFNGTHLAVSPTTRLHLPVAIGSQGSRGRRAYQVSEEVSE